MRILYIIFYLIFILSPITSKAMDKDDLTQQKALAAKGDSCFKAYDYFHALQYYDKLNDGFINHYASTARNIAEVYHRTGRNTLWANTLQRINKDSVTYQDLRSMFFAYKINETEDSLTLYGDSILHINPYDSEIVVSMASFFNDNQHPDKAMRICGDYMQKDSTNLTVMRQYGYAAHLSNQPKVALKTYKKLESNGFKNYESSLIIGLSLIKLDSTWESRPYLWEAVTQRKPNEYTSLLHWGNVQIACGEYDEGIGSLKEVLNIVLPDNELMYSIHHDIGEAYFHKQDYKNAVKEFQECLNYKTEKPLLYYNIAQMYGALKESNKEGLFYKKFLDKSHNLPETKENKDIIKQAEERLEALRKELKK